MLRVIAFVGAVLCGLTVKADAATVSTIILNSPGPFAYVIIGDFDSVGGALLGFAGLTVTSGEFPPEEQNGTISGYWAGATINALTLSIFAANQIGGGCRQTCIPRGEFYVIANQFPGGTMGEAVGFFDVSAFGLATNVTGSLTLGLPPGFMFQIEDVPIATPLPPSIALFLFGLLAIFTGSRRSIKIGDRVEAPIRR